MTTKIIKSFKSCYYCEVWKILKWKDNCIYKTKSIGFIHKDDIKKYPSNEFVFSPISTKLIETDKCTLTPYLSNKNQKP